MASSRPRTLIQERPASESRLLTPESYIREILLVQIYLSVYGYRYTSLDRDIPAADLS